MGQTARKTAEATPRDVLQQAIADHTATLENQRLAIRSSERARLLVESATKQFNIARAAYDDTKVERVEKMKGEVSGGADAALPRPGWAVTVRAKLTDAEDELQAAKDTLAAVELAAVDWQGEVARTKEWLETAAKAVMAEDHQRLLDEAIALQQELVERRVGLQIIGWALDYRSAERRAIDQFLLRVGDKDLPGELRTSGYWASHPAAKAWQAARLELMQRADAPLPTR